MQKNTTRSLSFCTTSSLSRWSCRLRYLLPAPSHGSVSTLHLIMRLVSVLNYNKSEEKLVLTTGARFSTVGSQAFYHWPIRWFLLSSSSIQKLWNARIYLSHNVPYNANANDWIAVSDIGIITIIIIIIDINYLSFADAVFPVRCGADFFCWAPRLCSCCLAVSSLHRAASGTEWSSSLLGLVVQPGFTTFQFHIQNLK